MAELLAFASSITAFIQLADRVISLSKFYLEALKDCPREIQVLFVEVSSLKGILESVDFLVQNPLGDYCNNLLQQLAGRNGLIEGCRRSLEDLQKLLPQHIRGTGDKRYNMSAIARILAWPLKRERAGKLLQEVSQYKTSINIALTAESA